MNFMTHGWPNISKVMLQMLEFVIKQVWVRDPPCNQLASLGDEWSKSQAIVSVEFITPSPPNTSHACPRHSKVQIGVSVHLWICLWQGSCWIEIEPIGLHNGCLASEGLAAACFLPTLFVSITLPKSGLLWRPDAPSPAFFTRWAQVLLWLAMSSFESWHSVRKFWL